MIDKALRNMIEGRGSLSAVERAAKGSAKARARMAKELALELSLKRSFAAIPPPPRGFARVQEALREAPAPVLDETAAAALDDVNVALRGEYARIEEPAGGFAAAMQRLKSKLAEVAGAEDEVLDISPGFEEGAVLPRLTEVPRRKSSTRILNFPGLGQVRDVLAAGKDLPENPDDLPPEGSSK